jgi:hypothetical protein
MKGVIVLAIVVAAVATLIAFVGTYWYIFAGLGVIGYIAYALVQKQKDKANEV